MILTLLRGFGRGGVEHTQLDMLLFFVNDILETPFFPLKREKVKMKIAHTQKFISFIES